MCSESIFQHILTLRIIFCYILESKFSLKFLRLYLKFVLKIILGGLNIITLIKDFQPTSFCLSVSVFQVFFVSVFHSLSFSLCLSVSLSSVFLSFSLTLFLSFCLSVFQLFRLSVFLSFCLSVFPVFPSFSLCLSVV